MQQKIVVHLKFAEFPNPFAHNVLLLILLYLTIFKPARGIEILRAGSKFLYVSGGLLRGLSSFHAAYNNSLYKVLLEEGINAQNRQHPNYCNRHTDADAGQL